ncbi:MAG: pyrroline-5-carboxylate reductase [Planctomycetota bacterium]|nr:pyrroline-5-carboxylate reductase [Planctomycetota bacterium]
MARPRQRNSSPFPHPLPHPLLLIGGGTMGEAIVAGAVRAGVIDVSRVVVVDPNPEKHAAFVALGVDQAACVGTSPDGMARLAALESRHGRVAEGGGGAGAGGAGGGGRGTGLILLAVKPQMLDDVAAALGDALCDTPRAVLSILAGVPLSRLAGALGGRPIRLMPNTPAQIGMGITALCPGPGATSADITTARRLFAGVGRVVDLPEELLDAFTGVAGSGPAYVFLLAEGMLAGAKAVGFDREQGLALVRATIAGAAALLDAAATATDTNADPANTNPAHADPAHLRALVTSKGGTTAAATAVLLERGVPEALRDAIVAARDRGRELAEG